MIIIDNIKVNQYEYHRIAMVIELGLRILNWDSSSYTPDSI